MKRKAVPEMVRKAFKQARTERPGAAFLIDAGTFVLSIVCVALMRSHEKPMRSSAPGTRATIAPRSSGACVF